MVVVNLNENVPIRDFRTEKSLKQCVSQTALLWPICC